MKAKNHCSFLFLDKSKTKSLNGGKCPLFMTNRAVGIGTCIQGVTIPSCLSSKMHLHKFHDQTKFRSWIANFRLVVCAMARNRRKGATFSYTDRKIGELSLLQEETIVVFYTRVPRDAVRLCGNKWETQRRSHLKRVSSSVPKVKEQTDVKKLKQSQGQSCDWSKKNPCQWLTR